MMSTNTKRKNRTGRVANALAGQIARDILAKNFAPGEKLNASLISEANKVSRTPVRDALTELAKRGFVINEPNKGFYVAELIPETATNWLESNVINGIDEYQTLSNAWLNDEVPANISEQLIKEKFGWSRTTIISVLNRATREGWAEQNPGYGWSLLPVAKSTEAFSGLYRFRMAIEPAALLEPTFQLDKKVITKLRDNQNRILDSRLGEIPDEIILEYGASFHEDLIKLSGNPYYLMALQRVNSMRKLMEYKAEINQERLISNCSEHIEILDMLEQGGIAEASFKLRAHLGKALDRKANKTRKWEESKEDH